jgi:hypothetical protein
MMIILYLVHKKDNYDVNVVCLNGKETSSDGDVC